MVKGRLAKNFTPEPRREIQEPYEQITGKINDLKSGRGN